MKDEKLAVSKECLLVLRHFLPDITEYGKVAMWLADSASQMKAVAAEKDATTCQR